MKKREKREEGRERIEINENKHFKSSLTSPSLPLSSLIPPLSSIMNIEATRWLR
jgi:hypothetical protein